MGAKPRILVVDDDPHLREVVRFALTEAGFEVEEAGDGAAAIEAIARAQPALIVLDIMMPEIDGLEVCRQVRRTHPLPIIFLSSRDDEVDRIVGLEMGGDDYLGKPFRPRELVARVKSVLRRAGEAAAPRSQPPASLARGPLRLDLVEWRASWQGQQVVLTVTEFQLLAALLRTPGKVFTREELVAQAYGETHVSDRTIDSHVRRIRQKFGAVGAEVVETVHGLGYRLAVA